MTLQQPTQQVFDGVVVGFAMLVHGIREQRRTYDSVKEMEEGRKRLQATAFHQGWDAPIPTDFMVRFKTDSGEEEDVDLYQYYVPHLSKGDPANKILCKCGAVAWRIGKAELFANMPPFVCDDCKQSDAMDEVEYLKEIDADPRDLPQ